MRLNQRALVFFGLAALFGFAATYTARTLLVNRTAMAAPVAVETREVVVLRADVGTGLALRAQELETVEWPAEFAPAGAFAEPDQVVGRVLRHPLAKGEPILGRSLMPDGTEAGLAAVIEEELRAVSVKVDPVIGVAGFVTPGSRVDVLATLRRIDRQEKLPYSKVILQDVPVLAIDQRMETAQNGEPQLVSVVTLEVSPQHAEQLIYSAHEGRLQLALRGPGDRGSVTTSSISVGDILGQPRAKRQRYAATSVQVLKGSSVSVNQF